MTYFAIGAMGFALGFYVCIRLTLHFIKKGKMPRYLEKAGLKMREAK